MTWSLVIIFIAALVLRPEHALSQLKLDLETSVAFSGYNDVRIPGDAGTFFSLTEELEADPTLALRGKFSYVLSEKSTIELLGAPLSVESRGQLDRDLDFEGVTFPAGTQLQALYRFNSYRFTYRYALYNTEKVHFGLGGTGKIRDAEISVSGGGLESKKTNVGFVPLINFRFWWMLTPKAHLLVEGDALAAPQGRAEDILVAGAYRVNSRVTFKLGYRILEGGADNDEVYNFALFHYAVLGLIIEL